MHATRVVRSTCVWLAATGWLPLIGCRPESQGAGAKPGNAVVYCSVDESIARDVLGRFQASTGVTLSIVFDSEAGKTTGLVNRIRSEAAAGRPRCDVFWSSELFNTINLAREGMLEPYASEAAADIPDRYGDPQNRWTATSLRARVIAFDPARTGPDELPATWSELAETRFTRTVAIANPLFGTTKGHVAAMFALWGPERGRDFLRHLRDGGAQVVDGNSAAVRAIIAGSAAMAVTDTDDVWVAQRAGASLDLRYLDMGDGGTLWIPCTVSMIRNGPNPKNARALVDYLVSADVEQMLAESPSRNVPVRPALCKRLGMEIAPRSNVDCQAIADAMNGAEASVREILIR